MRSPWRSGAGECKQKPDWGLIQRPRDSNMQRAKDDEELWCVNRLLADERCKVGRVSKGADEQINRSSLSCLTWNSWVGRSVVVETKKTQSVLSFALGQKLKTWKTAAVPQLIHKLKETVFGCSLFFVSRYSPPINFSTFSIHFSAFQRRFFARLHVFAQTFCLIRMRRSPECFIDSNLGHPSLTHSPLSLETVIFRFFLNFRRVFWCRD